MEIAAHLEKVERISALRGRLDRDQDFELWMWMSMTVATNAVNAALHHLGLSDGGDFYAHQIPGLYVEPPPTDGKWKKVIRGPGDLIHVGFPPLEGEVPEIMERAFVALNVLEDMREPYARGNRPIAPDLADACDTAFDECLALTKEVLDGPPGGAA